MRESATSDRVPETELTALEGLLQDAASQVANWSLFRDQFHMQAYEAFDILATWNNLRRFPEEKLGLDERFDQLDQLVRRDISRLTGLILPGSFSAKAWIEQERGFFQSIGSIDLDDSTRYDELLRSVRQHFDLLDNESLVADALDYLWPLLNDGSEGSKSLRKWINEYIMETLRAEHMFEFWLRCSGMALTPRAYGALCQSDFQEYRTDMITYDPSLWRITVKYRHVYEARLLEDSQCPNRCERPRDDDDLRQTDRDTQLGQIAATLYDWLEK